MGSTNRSKQSTTKVTATVGRSARSVKRKTANGRGPGSSAPEEDILRDLRHLYRSGDVRELRALHCKQKYGKPRTRGGYFSNLEDLASAAAALDAQAKGVYVLLNPVSPEYLGRAENRIRDDLEQATGDDDITRLVELLVDFDPVRVSGTSSTAVEHEAAIGRARRVRKHLRKLGWPDPVLADSGNGAHLRYKINVSNDEAGRHLLSKILLTLAESFGDSAVSIDTSVGNPSRICRVYGTTARKGDDTPERPHRRSRILEGPTRRKVVPRKLLEELVKTDDSEPKEQRPAQRAQVGSDSFDLWLRSNFERFGIGPVAPYRGGSRWRLDVCPFDETHVDSAAVFRRLDGVRGFRCHHDSCRSNRWKEFRGLAKVPAPSVPPDPSRTAPRIIQAHRLMETEFPPPKWAVADLLPEGLNLLAGKPKSGKSWLALALAIDVALGRKTLGEFTVTKGAVLYLALEDTQRRVRDRIGKLLGDRKAPKNLQIATEWAPMDQGGLEALEAWLKRHRASRLVFIDTLTRARRAGVREGNVFTHEYKELEPIKALADRYGTAICMIHHVRKAGSEDPLDLIAGTHGLNAVADATIILSRTRGTSAGRLFLTGRDVEERDLKMRFDGPSCTWNVVGEVDEPGPGAERRQILSYLRRHPGFGPKEIAEAVGRSYESIRYLLSRMTRDGQVIRTARGIYEVPGGETGLQRSRPHEP